MERQLVVSYAPGHSDYSVPMIRLKGKWLLKFGFNHGDKISVLVDKGIITVTKITEGENEQDNAANKSSTTNQNRNNSGCCYLSDTGINNAMGVEV